MLYNFCFNIRGLKYAWILGKFGNIKTPTLQTYIQNSRFPWILLGFKPKKPVLLVQVTDVVDKHFSYKFCHIHILPVSTIKGVVKFCVQPRMQ